MNNKNTTHKTNMESAAHEYIHPTAGCKLNVVIVGAGLGGLGAAIGISLAGHNVTVLEAASEIGEIGAGIQIHPNASRILTRWGLAPALSAYWTTPRCVNMLSWRGEPLASMRFAEAAEKYGSPFWDFHRANLHRCLLERAVELGATVRCKARVDTLEFVGGETTVVLEGGERVTADLVVGADGIYSKTREAFVGHKDPPKKTGDLAYRLLLDAREMLKDPELAGMVTDPQVMYWLGPDKHAVSYVLRGGRQFNMVLLVPDDLPDSSTVVPGNVAEMCALYADWDARIPKLLGLCTEVHKWKLSIRPNDLPAWSNPAGTFVLLGDAVHAALPYLAAGAGMALEDGAFLGLALGSIKSRSEVKRALTVYERGRRARVARIVERGNVQQYLYHLPDGAEQCERDRKLRMNPTPPGEVLAWRDPEFAPWLMGYDVEKDFKKYWEMPKDKERRREHVTRSLL
ncbi:hypothetical protein BZA05DRAFT_106304 [Tricharina praecox]|uniref:uncharacterized protein n=1 Tax=Tricharina praecox TaxID=43433 RepID=UPI00221F025D|nr:uncharacterized protein BZA05DRAFT_106304 [Tricharina praecox]KAI5857791.1 hypothetical protein BZA05DRAFT_106304 [Tricharina praecox]